MNMHALIRIHKENGGEITIMNKKKKNSSNESKGRTATSGYDVRVII